MTCTFFGHRDTNQSDVVEPLTRVLIELIENRDADRFYVGSEGSFDGIAKRVLKKLKEKYPHIRYSVVLAYLPREKDDYTDYSDTIYPEGLENVPLRFAIAKRNEWMVNHSDMVIAYVMYTFGGAAKYMEYAKKKGKEVINLYEIE